jgi:hypothetical protein
MHIRFVRARVDRQSAAIGLGALLIIGGVGFGQSLDASTRHQLAEFITALAASPSSFAVTEPIPTLNPAAPLRTF